MRKINSRMRNAGKKTDCIRQSLAFLWFFSRFSCLSTVEEPNFGRRMRPAASERRGERFAVENLLLDLKELRRIDQNQFLLLKSICAFNRCAKQPDLRINRSFHELKRAKRQNISIRKHRKNAFQRPFVIIRDIYLRSTVPNNRPIPNPGRIADKKHLHRNNRHGDAGRNGHSLPPDLSER